MTIDTAALRQITLSSHLLANGITTTNGMAKCPFHKDGNPSMSVDDVKGLWNCFAGCGGGSIIDFEMKYRGMGFLEASESLGGEPLNTVAHTPRPTAKIDPYQGYIPIIPVPATAPVFHVKQSSGIFNPKSGKSMAFTPVLVHPYRQPDNQLIGYVLRRDSESGKETPFVMWCKTPDGSEKWCRMRPPKPYPLYGIETITTDRDKIFIVEGEKSADAARRVLGAVALTWVGGSGGVTSADWKSLPQGLPVVLWPDNDAPGAAAMLGSHTGPTARKKGVAQLLWDLGHRDIQYIEPDTKKSDGWDAADAEAEGWHRDTFEAWAVNRTRAWLPPDHVALQSNVPPEDVTFGRAGEFGYPHFRALGYNHGMYYYMPARSKQILALTASQHVDARFAELCGDPLWWESRFSSKRGGYDERQARYACLNACHGKGVFTPDMLRGRGAWMDEGKVIFHNGNEIFTASEIIPVADFPSRYIYELAAPLCENLTAPPMNAKAASKVVNIIDRLNWENNLSGALLAGWCVIGPVCGIIKWRPHLWLTGESGSGKSTIIKEILPRIIGKTALITDGSTTEPSIRRKLHGDARPIIVDETEAESRRAADNLENLTKFARTASSGDEIWRVNKNGQDVDVFTVRSSFIFCSVNVTLNATADERRFSRLALKKRTGDDARAHYSALLRDIDLFFPSGYADRLLTRTLALMPVLLENIKTFTRACAEHLNSQAAADQIGVLLAGKYLLHSSGRITEAEAKEFLTRHTFEQHTSIGAPVDADRLLARIITHKIRLMLAVGTREASIGELILCAINGGTIDGINSDNAVRALALYGVKIDTMAETFTIANSSTALAQTLRDTPWHSGWGPALKTIEGAVTTGNIYFAPGMRSRGIELPIGVIGGD